uniref:Uncharacterized protein n=1 Tax=Sphaerodactylus townsendi TaxID=933632 RepID=A0ACB8FDA2_9SAUR
MSGGPTFSVLTIVWMLFSSPESKARISPLHLYYYKTVCEKAETFGRWKALQRSIFGCWSITCSDRWSAILDISISKVADGRMYLPPAPKANRETPAGLSGVPQRPGAICACTAQQLGQNHRARQKQGTVPRGTWTNYMRGAIIAFLSGKSFSWLDDNGSVVPDICRVWRTVAGSDAQHTPIPTVNSHPWCRCDTLHRGGSVADTQCRDAVARDPGTCDLP